MFFLDALFFCFSSRRRHTRCALVTGVQTCALPISANSMPCGAAAMRSWLARYQGRICLLFVFAAIVALHVFALGHRFVADDAWFARILDRQPLGEFLAFRSMHWSGRVPIEIGSAQV